MAQQGDVPATGRSWDVALGAALSHGPDFAGAQGRQMSLTPGLYLRYGRLSLASRSAFVVRSSDPGAAGSGLRLDLSRSDALRIGLGLRNESGRRESSSPELRGMGDLPRSLRLRLAARWALPTTVSRPNRGGTRADSVVGSPFARSEVGTPPVCGTMY